jgi:leader peptidase (prepilin peptidase) / N-methyltransferase
MYPAVSVLGGALGAVVASYVTTAALRATDDTAPSGERSACDGCRRPLSLGEMVPIASYVALRGRCGICSAPISPAHPWGELAGLSIGAAIALAAPDWRAAPLAVMATALLALAVVDARTRTLPDVLVGVVALSAAVLAVGRGEAAVMEGVVSLVASAVTLLSVRWASQAWRGQAGLGLGDVKLVGALALWLGAATPSMVVVAAVLGLAAFGVRGRADGRIAFGPMIALAAAGVGLAMEGGLWPRPL